MQIRFGSCLLELSRGDITDERTDAIVNAANTALAGGGGVDGAIHQAGGPAIMEETQRLYPDGCPTGHAVATTAGNLGSRFVFHAVGPVWRGGRKGEGAQLKSAYRACVELAVQYECRSISFPAISTGAYGYPVDLAARHSLSAVCELLVAGKKPEHARFVLFDDGIYGAYAMALDELIADQ